MAKTDPILLDLRQELDCLDDQLLALLNQRAAVVEQIAAHKQRSGAPLYVPDRERLIIGRLEAHNPGPFPKAGIRPVMQEVISACLSLEKGHRVAYLGPEGTYTHQAVIQQFGTSVRGIACGSITAVFDAVQAAETDYGVVPVENSTEGVVNHTLDTFLDSPLRILAEVLVEVSHCLLARHGCDERQITHIYSHPQALAQCRKWLDKNLPHVALVESPSTADAARAASTHRNAAAIASVAAARLYDLKVLRHKVQDLVKNTTRFLVIGSSTEWPVASGLDKTSLLVAPRHSGAPGALYQLLQPLAASGINLSKIESRPSRRQAWDYVFFIDLDGHAEQPPVAAALDEMAKHSELVKILGVYQKAQHQDR